MLALQFVGYAICFVLLYAICSMQGLHGMQRYLPCGKAQYVYQVCRVTTCCVWCTLYDVPPVLCLHWSMQDLYAMRECTCRMDILQCERLRPRGSICLPCIPAACGWCAVYVLYAHQDCACGIPDAYIIVTCTSFTMFHTDRICLQSAHTVCTCCICLWNILYII